MPEDTMYLQLRIKVCLPVSSKNSYGVPNSIYVMPFGVQGTYIHLIPLKCAVSEPSQMHGQQPVWVDDWFLFLFSFFCTHEQRSPQLGLGCVGRSLGQVARRIATGAVLGQAFPGTEEVGVIY